jgi:hypothetical protein
MSKLPVHVEVCLKTNSTAKPSVVKEMLYLILSKREYTFKRGNIPIQELLSSNETDYFITQNVERIQITDLGTLICIFLIVKEYEIVLFWQADVRIYVYQLNDEAYAEEMVDEQEEIPACKQWMLPSVEFDQQWDSLVFDDNIKSNLLEYAHTTMLFSDKNVNTQLVNWNRVILLHGPPGMILYSFNSYRNW